VALLHPLKTIHFQKNLPKTEGKKIQLVTAESYLDSLKLVKWPTHFRFCRMNERKLNYSNGSVDRGEDPAIFYQSQKNPVLFMRKSRICVECRIFISVYRELQYF